MPWNDSREKESDSKIVSKSQVLSKNWDRVGVKCR
jgi:hypothetical protein